MLNKRSVKSLLIICCLILIPVVAGLGQTDPQKKNNRRPAEAPAGEASPKTQPPVYFYKFSRPETLISAVSIEHDENGRGKISFLKKNFEEPFTDPIDLSRATLEKLKSHWTALNFLDSTENYQFERDYSHLGVIKIGMKKDGRQRTAEFNWTQNKDARALMNEYRKITNKYIWMFDINVSRENQPLETPRLMDLLDKLIRRDEIADAGQMIPFLKELGDDERLPLISRNHAARLINRIEKQLEKGEN